MPTVTYKGRWPTKRCRFGTFIRGKPEMVTQEWVESNRERLNGDKDMFIEGDLNISLDLNGDEQPDKGWTRKQLYEWLTLHDVRARAGLTKAQLLSKIRDTLGIEKEEEPEVVVEIDVPAVQEEPLGVTVSEPETTEEAMSDPIIEDDESDDAETDEVTE